MKRYVSDYAMNLKNKTAIVCPSYCGPNIFLTAEHFKDDQEFTFWKTVSDEDYRLRESAERREKANTVLLDDHPQLFAAADSSEAMLLARYEAAETRAQLHQALAKLRELLTPSQFRRFWLCVVCGKPRCEVAKQEGVSPSAVVKSIHQARHRISGSGVF